MQDIIEENGKKERTEKKAQESGFQLKPFLTACMRSWYWFVLSVVAFGCLAFLYAKSQTKMYSSNAKILITTKDSKSAGSQAAVFSDLGVAGSNNVISNEIYKLKSTTLMETVVNQLGLNIRYYGHVFLRDVNSYKTSPVQITPLQEVKGGFSMTVVPKGGNNLEFKINDGEWKKAHFGNKVNTEFGPIAITKTQHYTEQYVDYKIIARVGSVKSVAKAFEANLKAESADKFSDVVLLTFTCDNEQLSVDVLNALVAVYNQEAIDDKNTVARNTEDFIAERINSLAQDLSGVDSRIAQLKVSSMNSQMFSDPSTSLEFVKGANDADLQVSLANQIVEYIRRMNGQELIPSNTGISDAGIQGQIASYNETMLQYQKIEATSGKENPVMIELTNSLSSMKSTILQSLGTYVNSLRLKQSNAHAQEGKATGGMSAIPSQEKAITEVARQQQIKEQLYLYLLNKREENALQLAITEPNAKVIEKTSSIGQVAPAQTKIVGAGILLGLALPAAILYLIFWIRSLDTLIHTRRDIEDNCDIPIIGDIPEKRADQENKEVVVTETGRDRISEALRIVRSNLDFVLPKKENEGVVIQMTSTTSGEGKSFVALNLALTAAHAGKKVICIDLDLRKGRFSEYVNIKGTGLGISAYLSENVENIDDIIISGHLHSNLDFISIGAIPPNPTSLLMSDRLETVINKLKTQYDYIILDTVPFGMIADASLINRYVDLTLYVIREGKIDKRFLDDLQKMFDNKKIKNITILLNGIKLKAKKYGYGYGYGYGDEDEEQGKKKGLFKSRKKNNDKN
ncbi:MAG: polysaccharide biosynthesis tyrosine autokinase [Bacteroidales bacterium]|nr:polysaccharide biosynthesis tyrosine autokinase [Bacteroidales bacterium]